MTGSDNLLYGHNPLPRLVAVEPNIEQSTVTLFQRDGDNGIHEIILPFVPWLLTDSNRTFSGSQTTILDGTGHNVRIDFNESGWKGFLDARRFLRDTHCAVISYGNATKQFLIGSGITLFKEMSFSEIHRLQIDIETSSLSPLDDRATILLVALSNNLGHIEVLEGDERQMLHALKERVIELDPDVIEGHNIYGFDLPYIMQRCKVHNIDLTIGRQSGKAAEMGAPRNCAIGANSRPFTPVYVYGRHIIDTYLQVQRFDAPRGQISSYGLKECARIYNLSSDDRVIVDRQTIQEQLAEDPDRVRLYARQDVQETEALAALVSPTDFYQTQMTPDSYQSVAVTGNGEKVNSLLVREYLRAGKAVPYPQSSSEYPGGYTEVKRVGVISPVVKTDVESLYPSIMLSQNIHPESDHLGVFLPLLSELTKRRLSAKAEAKKAAKATREYAYWDGLQNSYKTLINSFYGYIGGPFYFNDFSAAKSVTVAGQEIVKRIAKELEVTGSTVIEIDTDGIYFRPPDFINTFEKEESYIAEIGSALPEGIRLAHDGRYAAMLSLKIKNYVLVDYDGKKIMKGSSLRSRKDEPFGREFLEKAVDYVIAGSFDELRKLYGSLIEQIQDGRVPISKLSRRERVTTSMRDNSQRRGIGALVNAGTVTVGDIVHVYNRSDGTNALVSEYNSDEDRNYYAGKLYKFAQRLSDAFPDEQFNELFPRPKPAEQRLQERLQSSFDF